MPTNKVEDALGAAADTFEQQLKDPVTSNEFMVLLQNNQKPHVMRVLSDLPGYVVVVQVEKEPT